MGDPAPGTEAAREAFGGPRHRRLGLARGIPFVGGKKATLDRLFREKGIVLTTEAWLRTWPMACSSVAETTEKTAKALSINW